MLHFVFYGQTFMKGCKVSIVLAYLPLSTQVFFFYSTLRQDCCSFMFFQK